MSSASPFRRSHPNSAPRSGLRRVGSALVDWVRSAGFWSAVVLPFVLLGLILTGSMTEHASLFGALVTANVLALHVGRDYKRT